MSGPDDHGAHIMSCYRFANSTAYWVDAENTCQGLHANAHLLALETPEEEDFVVHFRNYNNGELFNIVLRKLLRMEWMGWRSSPPTEINR